MFCTKKIEENNISNKKICSSIKIYLHLVNECTLFYTHIHLIHAVWHQQQWQWQRRWSQEIRRRKMPRCVDSFYWMYMVCWIEIRVFVRVSSIECERKSRAKLSNPYTYAHTNDSIVALCTATRQPKTRILYLSSMPSSSSSSSLPVVV